MFKNRLFFETSSKELVLEFAKKLNDEYKSEKVGYYYLPESMNEVIEDGLRLKDKYKDIKNIVILGIGGSSLGTKAISSMIDIKSPVKLHFLENLDATSICKTLSLLDKKNSLFFIISKSGTTLETLSLAKIVMKELDIMPNSKEFSKSFIVITDKGSKLEDFGIKHDLKIFHIPQNVGGRFSVLSACGLIPLTLCGYDTSSLLLGAKACKDECLNIDNTLIQKAYMYAIKQKANINVIFSYGDAFREFNAWYIQLWAESLGKKKDGKRVGLTPIGLIGSIDQHSFLQLIMEGAKDKTVTFVKQKSDKNDLTIPQINLDFLPNADLSSNLNVHEILNMQCDATMQGVINEGITTDIIELDTLDEWHVGYLIYYYELLTSLCGIMLNINTYNQPGVEIGKNILKKMLNNTILNN